MKQEDFLKAKPLYQGREMCKTIVELKSFDSLFSEYNKYLKDLPKDVKENLFIAFQKAVKEEQKKLSKQFERC